MKTSALLPRIGCIQTSFGFDLPAPHEDRREAPVWTPPTQLSDRLKVEAVEAALTHCAQAVRTIGGPNRQGLYLFLVGGTEYPNQTWSRLIAFNPSDSYHDSYAIHIAIDNGAEPTETTTVDVERAVWLSDLVTNPNMFAATLNSREHRNPRLASAMIKRQ